MGTVSERQQQLLNQVGTPLWAGYVNMLKTLESVFPSTRHWVLEFLQNSEDAMRTRGDTIAIRLDKDSLCVLNNGDTFGSDDFVAICDVNSRKLPSLGFRGYIGIGFKSIFRITSRIEVHSGNLHFAFDKDYWDEYKRRGIPLSKWPWEILPVETNPITLPEGFTTGFYVPLRSIQGHETLQEVERFLGSYDFPKEVILLLKNVKAIKIQTGTLSYAITKEVRASALLGSYVRETVLVRRETDRSTSPEEALYLLFRKNVSVRPDVLRDSETERVRRSDIRERELGLVFALDSTGQNIQALYGKLAGVYSFLPVEGEQTGLPFGIFGDFIPQVGRDLINYSVKWNHWMCDEVVEFFGQIVKDIVKDKEVFLASPDWQFFLSELLASVEYSSVSGPGREFWDAKLRNPVKVFLNTEALYPDSDGNPRKLDELMVVDKPLLEILGKGFLEDEIGKKFVHPKIEDKIKSKVGEIGIYQLLFKKDILEDLKADKQKMVRLYQLIESLSPHYIGGRRGKDMPLSSIPFVVADNDQLYAPNDVVALQVKLESLPAFLKATVATNKKFLHPDIARDEKAVTQLARCGLEIISEQTVIRKTQELINNTKSPDKCPPFWHYPDDLIKATLFLFSSGVGSIDRLVAEDGSLQTAKNTFAPEAPLDWRPLWEAGLLAPGYYPIHRKYLDLRTQFSLPLEKINHFLEEMGVHGFHADEDEALIEHTAYKIAEEKLKGHAMENVHDRTELGYDLECKGHCTKVFEVKGMATPRDVLLEESQVKAAQQKGQDYVLVCVYNLPAQPDHVGYKETPNPQDIWNPVERARVPKDRWLLA